ncbi:NTP transferase domain-containing protein [Nocardia noduli]|uniref:NTP transferase domain-containing protein n=1 Tax=Nocardia noduli TaxID=2815722 RepID=UPI001C21233A|nr:NTP transferase domain-containing protein [Nocardia noduli]
MTTVVVLAAGAGSRFAAPYSKELHPLAPGVSVIDPLLSAIAAMTPPPKTLVVVSASKLDLIAHLGHHHDELAVLFQQPRHGGGLSAALLTAQPWCEETVLVCLADQVYRSDPAPAFTSALSVIGAGAPVVVVAAECADPDRLRVDGALRVDGDVVAASAEKPRDPAGFNACWSALALTRSMLTTVASDLAQGHTDHLRGAPVVWGPQFANINHLADATAAASTYGGLG